MKKKIVKRFICIMFSMMCLCCILPLNVEASENKTITIGYQKSHSGEQRMFTVKNVPSDTVTYVRYGDGAYTDSQSVYIGMFSLSSFDYSFYDFCDIDSDGNIVAEGCDKQFSGQQHIEIVNDDNEIIGSLYFYNFISSDTFNGVKPLEGCQYQIFTNDENELYSAMYELLTTGSSSFEYMEFDEEIASYDSDLGYVQNVRLTSAYLKLWDETLNKYVYKENAEGELRIQWGATSTSGYDLNTDGTFVRVLTSAQVYDATSSKRDGLTSGAFHFKNLVGSVEASKLEYRDTYENMWKASQEDFEKIRDGLGYFNSWVRQDDIHLQIVRYDSTTGQWLYGGYLKIRPTEDGKSLVGVPLTPSGGMSIDSGGTQSIVVDEAYGTTYEDAFDNADNNTGVVGDLVGDVIGELGDTIVDDENAQVVSSLNGFIEMIGAWPSIIAQIFSFLPPWVLNFIGTMFAVASVVMLWKVIRG